MTLIYQAAKLWIDNDMAYYAAAFSYYAPLALVPLILISLKTLGLVYGTDYTAQVFFSWGEVLGNDLPLTISSAVDNLTIETNSFAIPLLGILFFSSICIVALNVISTGFQRLWNKQENGIISWLYRSLRSGLFIFVLQIYLLTIIGFGVLIKELNLTNDSFVSSSLLFVATATLFTFLYRFLYRFSPPIKSCVVGGIFSAFLFIIARYLVYAYIISTPLLGFYGTAGLMLILLSWIFVLSAIIFYGAAIAGIHSKKSIIKN